MVGVGGEERRASRCVLQAAVGWTTGVVERVQCVCNSGSRVSSVPRAESDEFDGRKDVSGPGDPPFHSWSIVITTETAAWPPTLQNTIHTMLALTTGALSLMAPPMATRASTRAAVRMAEKVELDPAVLASYMALPGNKINLTLRECNGRIEW